ncbi:MAG: hypothetical protein WBG05_13140 [Thermoanaerobaculia bacterium]
MWAEQELLENVPHRQVVFTIPKRLRIFFRYDRKLLGELAACAWRALRLYFDASFDGAEVTPGAVGFLQTAGELLNLGDSRHRTTLRAGGTQKTNFLFSTCSRASVWR